MKKKWRILLELVVCLCACLGFAGCIHFGGNGGTYYLYEDGEYIADNYIELSRGKWTDASGFSGDYKVHGKNIELFMDFFGQKLTYAQGTIQKGVLTLNTMGSETVYAKEGAAHVHAFRGWHTTTEPTCTSYGKETRACLCGKTETRSVEMLPHSGEWVTVRAATCMKKGLQSQICTVCHKETVVETEVDLANHEAFTVDNRCVNYAVCHGVLKYTEGLAFTFDEAQDGYILTGLGTAKGIRIVVPMGIDGKRVIAIGDEAFSSCYLFTSIEIPESVYSIGNKAFYDCSSLTNIKIPSGVGFIGDRAFEKCTSLASIEIPERVPSIGNSVFKDCNRLKSVTIGSGVTSIGDDTFYNCGSLTNIKIPERVTSIGDRAFSLCSSLTSIEIPSGVASIGDRAFYDCSALASIKAEAENRVYYSEQNCLIESETNTVILGCKNSVIPSGVTSIGDDAFSGCRSLISIEIPDSVTSIGDHAFYNCDSLTGIALSESVTSIGDHAFSLCSSLTSIEIPSGVTLIGDRAFYGCDLLENIKVDAENGAYYSEQNCLIESETNTLILGCKNSVIPSNVTSIGDHAFSGCRLLTSIEIPDSVTSIGAYAFSLCNSLTSIKLPEGVTSIGAYAFNRCSSLTEIKLPESLTAIGDKAFCYCSSLTNIKVPGSVTSIGNGAFSDCRGLESLTIDSGVTSIGDEAFYYCRSLASIEIPESVTSIGNGAFYDCNSLKNIKFKGTVSEWKAIVGTRWLTAGDYMIICADGKIDKQGNVTWN